MNLKNIALASATGIALFAAAPAFATPPHWAQAHGWRAKHYAPQHHHRTPAYVYHRARPVYVPPPVVYYAPPPVVYYAPPRPVLYGSVPIGDTRLRIGLHF
jgi:hypothetical protein